MKENEIELFVCQCESLEHSMIIRTLEEEPDVYVSVHLSGRGFWKRLKNGVKYIFGRKSVYGDFEEFIFRPEDAPRLQKVVDKLKEQYDRREANESNRVGEKTEKTS